MSRPRWRRVRVLVGGVMALAVCVAWAVTTEAGAALLLYLLRVQSAPASPDVVRSDTQAIVVLTGDSSRIDAGARLSLATGVPIAIIGHGSATDDDEPRSESMESELLRRYGIGPRWVDVESKDTRENALFAWCLLSVFGVRKVALVTNDYHMPRARRRFEAAGFKVIPEPTHDVHAVHKPLTWASFVPGRSGIQAAHRPVHEWAGLLLAPFERLRDPPRACPYGPVLRPP